jgi:hypothetical protein
MMRVRATDPRPCPKCGKIYRSAHTLRTHMEDKHTVCPGYRCVLCGTVAKSRNSLHSHMSRQHRGISTKDLPVVPMPAPFDAALASRLLGKAGVKVTPHELAARASPTAPRRSDLPKLDTNLLHMQHQTFPLPPSIPASMAAAAAASGMFGNHNRDDIEDLRVPPPTSSPSFMNSNGGGITSPHMRHGGLMAGISPKDFMALAAAGGGGGGPPGPMGSALLDTYLSMIAAAGGGDNSAMANALNFGHNSRAAAAFAAATAKQHQQQQAAVAAINGGGSINKDSSDQDDVDREDDMDQGELGSDADNDELSDDEDKDKSEHDNGADSSAPAPAGPPAEAPATMAN